MIIDFRYHIASLAAVFLALGLGILIGSSLLSDEKLYEQQGKLVDRWKLIASLRQDKRNLEEEIVSLELALKREEQFGQAALPLLTRNKLTGQRLAIVQLTQTTVSSEVSALKNCLQQAGAEVISTTSLLRYSDDEQLAEVLESEGDSMEQLINHLAQTLAMGLGREGLAPLERLGYLQLGGDYHLPVQTVILYLGNVTVPKEVATSLVQACSEYQVRVAAVENSGAPSSSLSEKGILKVDNIDQTSGKVALNYALATDGLGHFGIKEGAQAFLPELGKQEQ